MPTGSPLVVISQASIALVSQDGGVFVALGLNIFRGIAIILIAWFGIQTALASVSGASVRWDKFAGLLMSIAFCFGMLKYYQRPLPGVGVSFPAMITNQGISLAATIEQRTTEQLGADLARVNDKLEAPNGPSILDVMQVIRYYGTVIFLGLAEGAVLFVSGLGFIMIGIAVLMGPIFIPFMLAPQLEWIFQGWLRFIFSAAMYPVVAAAFIAVFRQVLQGLLLQYPNNWDTATIAIIFPQFMVLMVAFLWGVLKVPSIVGSLFSGSTGHHAFPGIGSWR